VLQENLNYSAEGLTKIFHKYFPTLESAQPYARRPEMIANKVYANRKGNSTEESGEGYRYRGRGPIQLTGKSNYTECSDFLFQDDTLIKDPDMLLDPEYALHSACWFWWKNALNNYADSADLVTMTKRINGGTIGLDDRIKHYNEAIHLLA
jgi:putative chitinase